MIKFKVDSEEIDKAVIEAVELFEVKGFLKAVGLSLHRWVVKNFDTEGSFVGGWEPLAESTIQRRRGHSTKILKDTGQLRQSYDIFGTRGLDIKRNSVSVGSKKIYAAPHHYGFRNVPARPQLPTIKIASDLALELIYAKLKKIKAL